MQRPWRRSTPRGGGGGGGGGGELQRLGFQVDYGKLNRALLEHNGRLFHRTKSNGRVVYCAIEVV